MLTCDELVQGWSDDKPISRHGEVTLSIRRPLPRAPRWQNQDPRLRTKVLRILHGIPGLECPRITTHDAMWPGARRVKCPGIQVPFRSIVPLVATFCLHPIPRSNLWILSTSNTARWLMMESRLEPSATQFNARHGRTKGIFSSSPRSEPSKETFHAKIPAVCTGL